MPREIDRAEVRRLLDDGAQLVEVLPAEEYKEDHLPGAVNILLRHIDPEGVSASTRVARRSPTAGTPLETCPRGPRGGSRPWPFATVQRIYEMSLDAGLWKLWRDGAPFSQRFTGRFSDDGKTIAGRWEIAEDGITWKTHFDLIYTKVE
ncbi:MAG: hypothetical protein M3R49_09730 [Chloroflexota bacterium]|nr:hypothetical protein [Chloroflexota bacterium]